MDAFRNIVIIACFCSIAISMLDIVTPEGKFKKQIRLIFSLVFIISILSPVVTKEIEFDFDYEDSIQSTSEFVLVQDTYYQSLAENYSHNLEKSLEQKLVVNNIQPEEILVNVNIDEENCIDITDVRIVLTVDDKAMTKQAEKLVKNEIGNYNVVIVIQEDTNEFQTYRT